MNKLPVFLTHDKGLTQTSANHLCNIATEVIERIMASINNVSFIEEHVSLISSDAKKLSAKGISEETLATIPDVLEKVSEYTAFIAWCREAIKAKDSIIKDIEDYTFNEYLIDNNITLEDYPDQPTYPSKPTIITDADIKNGWSIKEYALYLKTEAFAATFGKVIHKDGNYNIAMDNLNKKLSNPIDTSFNGRDTIIKEYEASVDPIKINETFFKLQSTQRQYEKALNGIKYTLKEKASETNIKAESDFRKAVEAYRVERQLYENKVQELDNTIDKFHSYYRAYVESEHNKASKLKIVIPDSMTNTWKELEEISNQ